jgi:hypothetical protein
MCLFALSNEHVIYFRLIDVKSHLFSSKIGWIQPKPFLGQIQTLVYFVIFGPVFGIMLVVFTAQIARFGWTLVHAYGRSPQLLSSKVKWTQADLILWRFWYNIYRHVFTDAAGWPLCGRLLSLLRIPILFTCALFRSVHTSISLSTTSGYSSPSLVPYPVTAAALLGLLAGYAGSQAASSLRPGMERSAAPHRSYATRKFGRISQSRREHMYKK